MPDFNFNVVLVALVCFLITYIPASLHVFILPDYLPLSPSSWPYYLAFDLSVLLVWINYYLSVRRPPGFVPSSYTPPAQLAPDTLLEIKQTTAAPRYCRTCSTYKPPRSHHCSTCNRCVLKMDHHCPWTNNCIGYRNQAHFVRFLLYVTLATSLCNLACLAYLYSLVYAPAYPLWYYNNDVFIRLVATVITLLMSGPVWLMVGGLACYHVYYVSTNCTTIEAMEKDRKALVRRHDGRVGSVVNPYRLPSLWANWAGVFGDTEPLWKWVLWSVPKGEGLVWPVNRDAEWEYVNAEPEKKPIGAHPAMGGHVRRDSEDGYVVDMARHPYGGYYRHIERVQQQEKRGELDVVVVDGQQEEETTTRHRHAHGGGGSVNQAELSEWSDMHSSSSASDPDSLSESSSTDDDDNVPLFEAVARRRQRVSERVGAEVASEAVTTPPALGGSHAAVPRQNSGHGSSKRRRTRGGRGGGGGHAVQAGRGSRGGMGGGKKHV